MTAAGTFLVALVIAVGLVSIVVPLVPGTLLIYGAIAVWAYSVHTVVSWVALGLVTVMVGAATVIKYLWPARRMRLPLSTLFAGGALGVVGFFVIPVFGLLLGFVCGVYLASLRGGDYRRAWASTVQAVKGVALSVGIEMVGGLAATVIWVVAVLVS